jgi:hypothetical protein
MENDDQSALAAETLEGKSFDSTASFDESVTASPKQVTHFGSARQAIAKRRIAHARVLPGLLE